MAKMQIETKIQSEDGAQIYMDDDRFHEVATVLQTNKANAPEEVKNSVVGAFLALISTIIGGGIVSIPYAFAASGFVVGFCVQAIVCICMINTVRLYLQARD